ncbi:MAG TPA: two-component regulator propeller domain-containing protein, partial [Arenimonas sp.]|nr:two-component regulator propeller domain-containing protein [Arenimonas sp.]
MSAPPERRRGAGRALIACALLLLAGGVSATTPASDAPGNPPLQFYGPRDYGAGPLNWSVLQDRRGLIYAANADGVLEFDGVDWRLIRTARQTRARALAQCDEGPIHVGAQGEFGYLAGDERGQLRFVSLSDALPAAEQDFSDVWLIHCLDDGVYFRSQRRLFRLQGERLQSWSLPDSGYSAVVDGRLYLFDRELGLVEFVNETFRPLPGATPQAVGDVQLLLPWRREGNIGEPATALLLGSRQHGLQLWQDGRIETLDSPLSPLLARDGLRGGRLLPNGHALLLTLAEGPLLIDANARLLRRLGRAEGVAGDRAFEVDYARDGALWLALDTGIARVAAFDALSRFDEATLGGSVLASLRLGDRLFVGSNTRLTWLHARPGEAEQVGITGYIRGLLEVDGRLLAAGNGGTFEVIGDSSRNLRNVGASELLRSRRDPARVWIAERDGLASLRWQDGDWIDEGKRWVTASVVRSLAEDRDGGLWLGTDLDGVLYVPANDALGTGLLSDTQLLRFGVGDGLPSNEENQVFVIGDEVRWRTRDGIYRFDAGRRRFEPDPRFSGLFAGRPGWQLSPRGGLAVDA